MTDTPTTGALLDYPRAVADVSEMSREDWLKSRHRGIGGSDAAAILGVSPWTSRYSLWADKTATEPKMSEATPAMEFGNLMEPIVRQMFADKTGFETLTDSTLYAHPLHEWMLANLDGLVCTDGNSTPDAVLEIKTARMEWDHVPAYYESQIQHYMAVTGMQHAYCAALFHGDQYQMFEVPRDDVYINRLIEAEAEFWSSVREHRQPEIDGSQSTYDHIRKAHEVEQGKSVELGADIAEMLTWRASAKEMVSQYEAEVREAEARIMDALQGAEVGLIDGKPAVTWKAQTRSSLDGKALKEAHPDLTEQFSKTNTFRVLRVK